LFYFLLQTNSLAFFHHQKHKLKQGSNVEKLSRDDYLVSLMNYLESVNGLVFDARSPSSPTYHPFFDLTRDGYTPITRENQCALARQICDRYNNRGSKHAGVGIRNATGEGSGSGSGNSLGTTIVNPPSVYKIETRPPLPLDARTAFNNAKSNDPFTRYRTKFNGKYRAPGPLELPLGLYPAQQQKIFGRRPVYPQIWKKYLWYSGGIIDGKGYPADFNFSFRSVTGKDLVPNSLEKRYLTWLVHVYNSCRKIDDEHFPDGNWDAKLDQNIPSIGVVEAMILCGFGEVLLKDTDEKLSGKSVLEKLYEGHVFENWSQFQSIISPRIKSLADPKRITTTFEGKTVETLEFNVPEECRRTLGDDLSGYSALRAMFGGTLMHPSDRRARYPLFVQEIMIESLYYQYHVITRVYNTAYEGYKLTSFWPVVVELEQYIRQFYDPNAASRAVTEFATSKAPMIGYVVNNVPSAPVPTTRVMSTTVSPTPTVSSGFYVVPVMPIPISVQTPPIQDQKQKQTISVQMASNGPQPMPPSASSSASRGPASGYVRGGYFHPTNHQYKYYRDGVTRSSD
jgi:hypothetical protein